MVWSRVRYETTAMINMITFVMAKRQVDDKDNEDSHLAPAKATTAEAAATVTATTATAAPGTVVSVQRGGTELCSVQYLLFSVQFEE